ncbi:MAG: FAD-dependent oxidoreductase [Pseudomonadales bacterium]|nr:FAD-dependent oxidoreductase [Pseudomonadales bacterium]
MSNESCVIVGASHAGVSLAMQLRREGWQGSITLLGAESELPYHRPPLSKEFLGGAKELDAMRLRPAKAFADNDIKLILGQSVLSVNREKKVLELQEGETLHYDKLALCVGASVRHLALSGDVENVFYLRTAADSELLRQRVEPGKKAVIIGAGYIGLEVAAQLSSMDVQVTVLESESRILNRVTSEPVSDYLTRLHEKHGVQFRFNTRATAIQGENQVESVLLSNGEDLDADLVVIGVGIEPNTALAETAGLVVNNGIVVDEFARTNDPDIFAAGDCACHPSQLYQRPLRLESVQNANDQARVAAANICGKQTVYDVVPWFWSDQYALKLQTAGLQDGHDQLVLRGDPGEGGDDSFAVLYLRKGVLIAADCVARPKEFMACKALIKAAAKPDPAVLADESVEPAKWMEAPDQA